MNLDRFETFIIEFFNSDILESKIIETEVEFYYQYELNNGMEFMVKEPKEKEDK